MLCGLSGFTWLGDQCNVIIATTAVTLTFNNTDFLLIQIFCRNESAINIPHVLHYPTSTETSVPWHQLRTGVTAACRLENRARQVAAASLIPLVLQMQQAKSS